MNNFYLNEPHLHPSELIARLLSQSSNNILSTSFSLYSPVLLKLVVDLAPSTPIVWVDTGYNTSETYQFADKISAMLNLNLNVYHPKRSVAHRRALDQEPGPDSEDYDSFVEEVKLEPFRRALHDFNPKCWITGIRKEESQFRESLNIISSGPNEIVKFAPLFHWTEYELNKYMSAHGLPTLSDYFDPTKTEPLRECGLHCRL